MNALGWRDLYGAIRSQAIVEMAARDREVLMLGEMRGWAERGSRLPDGRVYVQCAYDRAVRLGSQEGPAEIRRSTVCHSRKRRPSFITNPLEVFHDPDHSGLEERYIAAGFTDRSRLVLVVHCENETGTEIRIISARKATRNERTTLFGGILR